MRSSSVVISTVALATLLAAAFSPLIQPISDSPCAQCHGNYSMHLDILEGNAGNVLPSNLNGTAPQTVTVVLKADCNAPKNNVMSSVRVTLTSRTGHFTTPDSVVSVGSLGAGQTATASWQITAVSDGADALQITATGQNTHNSLQFSDSYTPAPALTISLPPPVTAPSIRLTAPDAGVRLSGGSMQTVSWNAQDANVPGCHVALYYSTDNFASVNNTVAGNLPADRPYCWTLPSIDSGGVTIKAAIVNAGGLYNETTGAPFTVDSTPPAILSVEPAGGSNGTGRTSFLVVRFSEPVDQSSAAGAFRIAPDPGGVSWNWDSGHRVMTAVHNMFDALTVYTCTLSAGTRDMSVPGNANATALSWSFTTAQSALSPPSITLSSPSAGDRFYWGDTLDVRWSASGGQGNLTVDLSLSENGPDGPWFSVGDALANSGHAPVSAPSNLSGRMMLWAVATDEKGNTSQARSDLFSVAGPMSLDASFSPIAAPLASGGSLMLYWNVSGGATPVTVAVNFKPGPGTAMQTVVSGRPSSGSYEWTVPAASAAAALLYINATDGWNSSVEKASPPFAIVSLPAAVPTPPLAVFGITQKSVFAGKPVLFDASGSSDPDGKGLYFIWDFADGTAIQNTTATSVTHIFGASGLYGVRLTVGNGAAETVQAMSVSVGKKPPAASDDRLMIFIGVAVLACGFGATLRAAFGADARPAPTTPKPTSRPATPAPRTAPGTSDEKPSASGNRSPSGKASGKKPPEYGGAHP
jgi:hypothetical protein